MKDDAILNIIGTEVFKTITLKELAVIPFGSVEYHGPHAPLGTDSFIAQELSSRVGKRLKAIICPLIAFTTCPISTQGKPGTIHIDPDVMSAYIAEILRGLFRNGIQGVLALNAHDGNIETVKYAADQVALDYPDCFILHINWWETLPESEIEALGLYSQHGGHGHGGPLETSAAWAVARNSVDLGAAEDIDVDSGDDTMMSNFSSESGKRDWPGYSGRISESSIEKGLTLLKLAEDKIVEIVRDWLNDLE
jgi:creatinine amidohydrolase